MPDKAANRKCCCSITPGNMSGQRAERALVLDVLGQEIEAGFVRNAVASEKQKYIVRWLDGRIGSRCLPAACRSTAISSVAVGFALVRPENKCFLTI